MLGFRDALNTPTKSALHTVYILSLRQWSLPRAHQWHYNCLCVSSGVTSQWSRQYKVKSGFLYDHPLASKISLPLIEAWFMLRINVSNAAPPPTTLLLLIIEYQSPPGMKGNEETSSGQPAQCTLPRTSTPSPSPDTSALRQILWINKCS